MQNFLTRSGARAGRRVRSRAAQARPCETLEPRRLLAASVAGTVYQDNDGDNVRDAGEPPLAGRTVYVDVNRNGYMDPGDRMATSGADGAYRFDDLAPPYQFIGQLVPDGWKKSSTFASVNLVDGGTTQNDLGSVASWPSTLVLDRSFGFDGRLDLPFFTTSTGNVAKAVAVAEQADGKLIVAYEEVQLGTLRIQRFNADGALDVPFSENARLAAETQLGNSIRTGAVAVLPDGKILVGGGSDRGFFSVARFNSNGTLDTTFGSQGMATKFVGDVQPGTLYTAMSDLLVQAGGRIVAVGESTGNLVAAGFTATGAVDAGFGTSGVARQRIVASDRFGISPAGALAPDGRIVASAVAPGLNGTTVVRWTADGKTDATFGPGGTAFVAQGDFKAADVVVQPDGAIVLGGWSFPSQAFTLARLNPDGTPDGSFGTGGYVATPVPPAPRPQRVSWANALTLLRDGRILAAGGANVATPVSDVAFVQYTPDGRLDPTFNGGIRRATLGPGNEAVQRVVRLRDGTMLALATVNDFSEAALLKLVDPPAPFASIDASRTLVFTGTGGRDEAIIDRSGDTFTATLNGETLTFAFTQINAVRADLLGGDDVLALGNLRVPVTAAAGDGADWLRLFGTNGGDTLAVGTATVTRNGVATTFTGAETLYVAGGTGGDAVTYAADAGPGPKTTLELFAGDDVVTVTRGDPVRRLEIRGGAGNDTVTVVANVDPAQRASVFYDGELGADTLTARGTAGADTITVDDATFSGIGSGSGTSVEAFLVEALGGADVINVTHTTPRLAATVDAGAGDDVINIGHPTFGVFWLPGDATVRGGAGNDVIHADDRRETDGWGYFLDPDSFTRSLTGKISYDGVEAFTLDTGSGDDGLVITPSATTTYTLDAGAPAPPLPPARYGDALMLGYGGAEGMARTTTGTGAGQYTFSNRRPVRFAGVERFDELKPAVVSGTVQDSPFAAGPVFTYTFNKEVSYSVDRGDLVIRNADTGEVWTSDPDVQHNFETHTSTFQFFQKPPPGRYVATLSAAGIVDDAENPLTEDFVLTFGTPSFVRQRLAFYNRSRFDGDDAAVNTADDGAIAADKSPLYPGQLSGFANMLTDPAGITGVMMDVDKVPAGAALTAADFTFRVGRPGTDPAAWAAAPAPSAVQVRRGAGLNGSDRVTLAWPDNAIRNTWLQVTAKANERTGLAAPDVFYLASLAGESGDAASSQAGARVTALDLSAVKRALNTDAAVTSRADFNRDGRVNALDLSAAKANLNGALDAFTAPSAAAAAPTPVTFLASSAPAYSGEGPRRVWDDEPAPDVLAD